MNPFLLNTLRQSYSIIQGVQPKNFDFRLKSTHSRQWQLKSKVFQIWMIELLYFINRNIQDCFFL
jgi:hypothetical protein